MGASIYNSNRKYTKERYNIARKKRNSKIRFSTGKARARNKNQNQLLLLQILNSRRK